MKQRKHISSYKSNKNQSRVLLRRAMLEAYNGFISWKGGIKQIKAAVRDV